MSEQRVKPSLRDAFFVDPFFSVAWEDFDRMHRDLVKDAHTFWGASVTHNEAEENKETKRAKIEHDESKTSKMISNPFMPRRTWMLPRFLRHSHPHAVTPHHVDQGAVDHQLISLIDDESKFEISLDTHDYEPQDIEVEVKERELVVRGHHEEQVEHGVAKREFVRHFKLPDDCHVQNVVANVSKDGVMLITAPKKDLDYGGVAIKACVKGNRD